MNKIFAVVISIVLLATGIEGLTTSNVSASPSGVIVIINGQPLKENRHQAAFKRGATVMLPLKDVANALKYQVSYEPNTGTIQFIGIAEKIALKLREDQLKDDVAIKEDRLFVPVSFFAALGLVTAYDADLNLAEVYTPEVTAGAIAGLLTSGQYEELESRYFSDRLKRTISARGLQQSWDRMFAQAGHYQGLKLTQSSQNEEHFSIQCVLDFAETEVSLGIVLDKSGKIVELRENSLSK